MPITHLIRKIRHEMRVVLIQMASCAYSNGQWEMETGQVGWIMGRRTREQQAHWIIERERRQKELWGLRLDTIADKAKGSDKWGMRERLLELKAYLLKVMGNWEGGGSLQQAHLMLVQLLPHHLFNNFFFFFFKRMAPHDRPWTNNGCNHVRK